MMNLILMLGLLAHAPTSPGGESFSYTSGCWVPQAITSEFLRAKIDWMPRLLTGPAPEGRAECLCTTDCLDMDRDGDIDLRDWAEFEVWMSEENPAARVERIE